MSRSIAADGSLTFACSWTDETEAWREGCIDRDFHSHYSDVPVIYVRVPDPRSKQRIGFRLVDERHRLFAAEMEPEGGVEGIVPFLIRVPANSCRLIPELVLLPRVEGEFLVNMPKTEKRQEPETARKANAFQN